jgi:hypothetical protein
MACICDKRAQENKNGEATRRKKPTGIQQQQTASNELLISYETLQTNNSVRRVEIVLTCGVE